MPASATTPPPPSHDYDTAAELLALCRRTGDDIAGVALARECVEQDCPPSVPLEKMLTHYRTMRASIRNGLAIRERSPSGLSGGDAARLFAYAQSSVPLLGADFVRTIAYGFAVLEVNAQFGRIVATPTAGAAGIVPACLAILEETRGVDEARCARALFTAAGIGVVIGKNACFSGAQGGCQAEVGSASCMAAAAIAEACGGTPEQACAAGAFALMNTLGLVCDPVGGYVEVPCVSRNGMFAVHSFLAATMALAGVRCVVPLDDVVLAMRDIGRRLPPALKETARGGLAQTPSGLKFPPKGF
ncbi:MAG: L-serine ammonia-lyase, iron-sulfur-dependent, subunit alpha [Puniceicoccales bacterium]|jgi:L-serine dehydratase|nr:L-serine ammonia-lyase, iron-sulfur-dependent, subunit alpha [Puniceicoccales bacterium]